MQACKSFPRVRQSAHVVKRLERWRNISKLQAVCENSTVDGLVSGTTGSTAPANGHRAEAEQSRGGRGHSRRAALYAAGFGLCLALQQPRSAYADAGTLTVADVTPPIAPASPLTKRYDMEPVRCSILS